MASIEITVKFARQAQRDIGFLGRMAKQHKTLPANLRRRLRGLLGDLLRKRDLPQLFVPVAREGVVILRLGNRPQTLVNDLRVFARKAT